MFCIHCGKEIDPGDKFCMECGKPLTSQTTILSLDCPKCGGTLEWDGKSEMMYCPYCGHKMLLSKSDMQKKQSKKKNPFSGTKKSTSSARFLVTCIFCILFLYLAFFCYEEYLKGASVLFFLAFVLFLLYLLIQKNIISIKHKRVSAALLAAGIVTMLPAAASLVISLIEEASYNVPSSDIDWEEIVLSQKLPQPNNPYGALFYNSDESLWIELENISAKEYAAYKQACIDAGYTIDPQSSDTSYNAFNEEGYELNLAYWNYDNQREMRIELDALPSYGTIVWPGTGLGALLPKPETNKGNISSSNNTYFMADLADMDQEAYQAYIQKLIDAGFSKNQRSYSRSFSAENEDGIQVSLYYEGFNQVSLYADNYD
jgi:DNA-directed RNA polymerase subunit RPC12/RpoP